MANRQTILEYRKLLQAADRAAHAKEFEDELGSLLTAQQSIMRIFNIYDHMAQEKEKEG